jgi:hypothetical protein
MTALLVVAAVGAILAAGANAVVIETHWVETAQAWQRQGVVMRFYVRKIELEKTTWTAWVGITNASDKTIQTTTGEAPAGHNSGTRAYFFYDGPSLLWYRYIPSGIGFAGGTISVARKAKSVQPGYPTSIAAHKSWFGVFSGSLKGVPHDRFLHVGFGQFSSTPGQYKANTVAFGSFSTVHQFKLPRRL